MTQLATPQVGEKIYMPLTSDDDYVPYRVGKVDHMGIYALGIDVRNFGKVVFRSHDDLFDAVWGAENIAAEGLGYEDQILYDVDVKEPKTVEALDEAVGRIHGIMAQALAIPPDFGAPVDPKTLN